MLKKPVPPPPTTEEEGPRSFGFILPKIADGGADAEMSLKLFDLTKILKDEAKYREKKIKGSITLKLELEVDGADDVPIVKVTYDVNTKAPKPQRRAGHFWFSKGGNLTHEAPKQTNLPLREAGDDRRLPRESDDDAGAAREA